MRFILRTLGRIVLLVGAILFLLFLWRPAFVVNAGNALLNSVGSSTAYGSAMVVPSLNNKSGAIQVSLQGLTSNLHYVITLNQGSCNGTVLKTFTTVTSDSSGNVSNAFSLSDLKLTAQPNLWINIHQGSSSGATVACGQVQINNNLLTQLQTSNTPATGNTNTGNTATVPSSPSQSSASNTGFTNGNTADTGDGNLNRRHHTNPDLPYTGVAPGDNNTYDNYKGPHKY